MISTLLLVSSLLFQASAGSLPPEVLTNTQVVRLLEAGLPADLVVEKIRRSPCRFTTDTDALVELTKQKVPERVIRAMLEAPVAAAPAPAATTPAPPPVAPASASPVPALAAPSAPVSVPSAVPAERPTFSRLSVAHDLTWKGAKTLDCNGTLAITIEGFEFKPSGACTESAHVPWSSVKRYCYIPSRILGDAQLSFVVRNSRGWLFTETSKASRDELNSLVQMLRTSSIEVRESCQ
jgi:hypothetical protein